MARATRPVPPFGHLTQHLWDAQGSHRAILTPELVAPQLVRSHPGPGV